jgi:tetratricopeptide (TPR) repeat protein
VRSLTGVSNRLAALVFLGALGLFSGLAHAQDTSSDQGDAAFNAGDVDPAIAQATQMIDANPEDMTNFIRRGRLYFAKADYDHAIADFSLVLQSDPTNAIALFQRARSYYRKDDLAAALADYNQFIQLRPASAPAFINRGAAYLRKGDDDDAIADESQAISLKPNALLAYLNRGRAYLLKGDDDHAIADFTQALQIDPSRIATYIARGRAYGSKGDYGKARADFISALKLDRNTAAAYNNLAWQMATCPDPQFRDGKSAVEGAEKACELTGWMVAADVDTLAAAYAESGDFDSAVNWETKFLTYHIPEPIANAAQARLSLYQNHQPYHRDDEAVSSDDDTP